MRRVTLAPTNEDVTNRLRPIFQRAVRDRTGVSYLLSEDEAKVFSDEDLVALEAETGYPPTALPIVAYWSS